MLDLRCKMSRQRKTLYADEHAQLHSKPPSHLSSLRNPSLILQPGKEIISQQGGRQSRMWQGSTDSDSFAREVLLSFRCPPLPEREHFNQNRRCCQNEGRVSFSDKGKTSAQQSNVEYLVVNASPQKENKNSYQQAHYFLEL